METIYTDVCDDCGKIIEISQEERDIDRKQRHAYFGISGKTNKKFRSFKRLSSWELLLFGKVLDKIHSSLADKNKI